MPAHLMASGTESVVRLEAVGKAVCLDGARAERYAIRDALFGRRGGLRPGERWAIKDVSLDVRRGELVGILADKHGDASLLAGLIGGLLRPDAGKVEVHDTVALFNQLGKGFKPTLTVWENVRFFAVLMGAPASGLRERCQRILELAGLTGSEQRRLQDLTRVQVRSLAFSTFLHLDAQVLIFAGVSIPGGDRAFRERASAALAERLRSRTGIIFTDRPEALPNVVSRVLVFNEGALLPFETPAAAFACWTALLSSHGRAPATPSSALDEAPEDGDEADPVDLSGPAEADEPPASAVVTRPATISDVTLNGTPAAIDRSSFVLTPGEVVTLELTLLPNIDLACERLVVQLNAADVRQPIAIGAIAQDLRFVMGQRYRVGLDIVVPRLQRGRFGVSMSLEGTQALARPQVFKLFAFGTRTDLPLGTAVALDVRGAQVKAEVQP